MVGSRCGFHCMCSVRWNSEWWIIDKCTWEGWGDCSQNFVMKKMPEENCAFNNLEVRVWHEVSWTCIPSMLLLYVRVCLWQFQPEYTWGSCSTLLEEDKNWVCVVFSEYPPIAAYCFLKLERDYIRCVIQQGLLLNQVFQCWTVKYFWCHSRFSIAILFELLKYLCCYFVSYIVPSYIPLIIFDLGRSAFEVMYTQTYILCSWLKLRCWVVLKGQ